MATNANYAPVNLLYIGNYAAIDTTTTLHSGNTIAENASDLVGLTVEPFDGSAMRIRTLTVGNDNVDDNLLATNDHATYQNETLIDDQGGEYQVDAQAWYSVTINYVDDFGTAGSWTGNLTALQLDNGDVYLQPSIELGTQDALDNLGTITDVTINSLLANADDNLFYYTSGTTGTVACYCTGSLINTPLGERPIETLKAGDYVTTKDNGAQPIRWIGHSTVAAEGKLAPIRICAGALGNGLPRRDLFVSRQHRMLLSSKIVERMTGNREALVAANKLVPLDGIDIVEGGSVGYYHLMCDAHEIIYAEGAPSETLLPGPNARKSIPEEAWEELTTIFPDIEDTLKSYPPARVIPELRDQKKMIQRHLKNAKPVLELVV